VAVLNAPMLLTNTGIALREQRRLNRPGGPCIPGGPGGPHSPGFPGTPGYPGRPGGPRLP